MSLLSEYQQTLAGIQASASDDCVRILTETGALFGETRERVRKIREALTAKALALLRQARQAIEQVWPRLSAHAPAAEVATHVEKLKSLLASESFIDSWDEIKSRTSAIVEAYKSAYLAAFDSRRVAYTKAIKEIKERPEWTPLSPTDKDTAEERIKKQTTADTMLAGLLARVGSDEDRSNVANGITLGKASLAEMESDLVAVDALKASVLIKLQELSLSVEPKPVKRLKILEFFNQPIRTQDELDATIERLRASLQKCIDEETVVILE